MSTEDNKNIVRRFLTEVVGKGDLTHLDQLLAPNYRNMMTGQQGIDAFKQYIGAMHSALPDMAARIDNVVGEGDEVAARVTVTGTNTGSFMGGKPTGKAVTVRLISYFHLSNGRIVEDDPIPNQDLMQLLGAKTETMESRV
jgi:predicted ester cyclase